jgi:triphosphoribosyl-dephospho-CoA synthase
MTTVARAASGGSMLAADVAIAAQLACLLEASAPKPGNVSPGRHFADMRYEDFLASAAAIGGPLAGAGTRPLGATVRLAVEATARWARTNTNLGIVLLLAPLARAALLELTATTVRLKADSSTDPTMVCLERLSDIRSAKASAEREDVPEMVARLKPSRNSDMQTVSADTTPDREESGFSRTLRDSLRRVLEATTVQDARDVYAAIRCAAPGGLGRAEAQDVADEPTMTLLDVMRLAKDRDGIAREYATAFEVTFLTAAPALARARAEGLSWDDAASETFLTLLAAAPDTHVIRRGGAAMAAEVSRHARLALAVGGVRSERGRRAIDDMDRELRDARHMANPGTTADLTAAAIFVALLEGGWQRSLDAPATHGGCDAATR